MAAHRKPLGITAERLAALLDLDPSTEHGWRWRHRHPSEFDGDERMCAVWNAKYAGKEAGSRQSGNGRPVIGVDGKIYDPRRLIAELGEEVAAIASSSAGLLPHDGAANGDGVGSGVLASVLRDASRSTGLSRDKLTVLHVKKDPYRRDTPKGHREGRWFAEHFNRLLGSTARLHLRGFHYVLVSRGGVVKADGTPYVNTDADFFWLIEEAAKAARWLGYVEFERIIDNRNDAPVIYRHRAPAIPTPRAFASLGGDWSRELGEKISISDCRPWASLGAFGAEQPYCFAFFGEKSSLADVLDPIAQHYGANMYLCSGEISDTLVYDMARDGAADGRPLVVFTFSDFDPSGWQMPISIGRKLQALRDLKFPGLRAQLVPVSLTLEQVVAERLPTTPVKQGDNRGEKWDDAFGPALRTARIVREDSEPAQVEIDALAALRPDVLRRITGEKIAPYWDETLARRAAAVKSRWEAEAQAAVDAQVDDEQLAEIRQEAAAAEAFNEALDELAEAKDHLSDVNDDLYALCEEIDLPEPPEPPDPEIDLDAHEPLIDLDWSFEDATAALKAHKAYEGGDDDGNGAAK